MGEGNNLLKTWRRKEVSHAEISGDRSFQVEGKASAKVLRQKQAWCVRGRARRLVWLKWGRSRE